MQIYGGKQGVIPRFFDVPENNYLLWAIIEKIIVFFILDNLNIMKNKIIFRNWMINFLLGLILVCTSQAKLCSMLILKEV